MNSSVYILSLLLHIEISKIIRDVSKGEGWSFEKRLYERGMYVF